MAPFQTWTAGEPYLNLHCGLAEGPYHEKEANVLRFVDIKKKQVHFVNLDRGPESLRTVQLDVPVGVTADIAGVDPADRILVGLKYGVAVLDVATGQYEYVAKLHDTDNERLRANDGAVDPHGRFWLGSMTDFGLGDFQAEGTVRSCYFWVVFFFFRGRRGGRRVEGWRSTTTPLVACASYSLRHVLTHSFPGSPTPSLTYSLTH
ncbi:Cell growth-regulated protein [Colletotrichum tanaceti]|uniref:Cell growth-regulated protein n=1 Tax=Colletotrichum tanaceti TaxID=1306861 RepID=A0A4V6DH69_9PEZI|nr:Cell growth-regulated protein [Colletotrichum tanaceti]